MSQVPFIVVCTSCQSILEVRNPGLIGQIVACPKCRSMVLIEPTNQSRDRLRAFNFRHQGVGEEGRGKKEEGSEQGSKENETESSLPLASYILPYTEPGPMNVTNDELGPVATELQAELLKDVAFDNWQKRRLVLVAVGTICLLTTFAVFLWLRFQASDTNTETPSQNTEAGSVDPPPGPGGVGASQINGQPNTTPQIIEQTEPRTSESEDTDRQDNITPLPSADEIKVEDQPNVPVKQSNAPEIVTDPTPSGPMRPPRPISGQLPGQPVEAVRVTATPGEVSDDPFDDIDNSIVINNKPATKDSVGNLSDGGMPDKKIDDSADETSGLANLTGTDSSSSTDITGPGDEDREITDSDDDAGSRFPENDSESENNIPKTMESVAIDIDERLSLAVTSMSFEKKPIFDVVRILSDISDVQMQLDIDELHARGLSVETPLTLQLQETTIAGIIDAVMQKTRLTRLDGNGYLVFGYPDEQVNALRTARYDMSRLAVLEQNPISAELAAGWLTELLVNQAQNPKTANAVVTVDGNEVVVVGTTWLQDQAKRLLLSLFYLRDIQPENCPAPERLAPEVFGWDRVNAPLSFNLVEPIPLKHAARLIEGRTKMRVLIDHAALREAGLTQKTQVTSRISHGTIDTVLRGMLEPLGLTYRIVEANAVEITTPSLASEKMTIEAHRFAPLTDGKTPELCAEELRQAFGGDANWNLESGNGTSGGNDGGVIVIDPVSGYMLVRQSQPMQREIRVWFGGMQSEMPR